MACGAGGGDLWDEGHVVVEAVGGQEHEIELGGGFDLRKPNVEGHTQYQRVCGGTLG